MHRIDVGHVDTMFTKMIEEDLVPGLVAYIRLGNDHYCKAFGSSDIDRGTPMKEDAIFRFYSNSKVFAGALALDLEATEVFSLEDPVSAYIPSFNRDWSILEQTENGQESLNVHDPLVRQAKEIRYSLKPANSEVRLKHLISETSGIGYDFNNGDVGLACNTLRELAAEPELYFNSQRIVGSSLSLENFCEVIADAGVLSAEPGEPTYGHGATVLGRIIEVTQDTKLSTFIDEKLFAPCNMDVRFFFPDDDQRIPRIPMMYAPKVNEDKSYMMVPCDETLPNGTNQTDHYAGPRACESLDTGLCMSVENYAKFLDVLLNNGMTPTGTQVLDQGAVHALTHDQTDLGSFSHGWQVQPCRITTNEGTKTTTVCFWGGYACTTAYLFPDEKAYMILGQQIMSYTPDSQTVVELKNKQVNNILSTVMGEVSLEI